MTKEKSAPSQKSSVLSTLKQLPVASRQELRDWLAANHSTSTGIWVVTHKVSAGGTVRWNDVVEEVLCFGWVDSLPRKLDADRSMLLITPRKPKSNWSAKNKAHVADLEKRGLMQPAGRAAVALSKNNGTWAALDAVSALQVPPDLQAAFKAFSGAEAYWNAFPPSIRRGILEWIAAAKRPETRAARVEETARLAAQNIRANQWKGKK